MRQEQGQIRLAPTDLSNYLSCRHLSRLDLAAAKGLVERPSRYSIVIEELIARGIDHEESFLAHLRKRGLYIRDLSGIEYNCQTISDGLDKTRTAMQQGVDVIFQGTLADENWSGRPDFLCRVERKSDLGDWSYEVTDTKLARDTKAGTILQLCVYSYLLENLQGPRPEFMYVVTPGNDFEPLAYRIDDYAAYFRLVEKGIDQFIEAPTETYPEMVSHCDFCTWWTDCEKRRRGDDHLCYVAGISRHQIEELNALSVLRLAELAQLDDVPEPSRGSLESLLRVRDQARVQWEGREQNKYLYELKEPFEADHGLALLPEPTPDDIFLDFEGNHFAENSVQEYLAGYVTQGPNGQDVYTSIWAKTLEEEKEAFKRFMDIATATRTRNPNAHIYHYAPYEPSALKRLMGRFATREVELDELLRGEAFVDLHSVVKRALIASVERYSIKDLEPFFGYARQQDLREASMSRHIVEHAIEADDLDDTLNKHLRIVEDYNREDCESTRRLRDWLEQIRQQLLDKGENIPRPVPKDSDASEEISDLDKELQRLRDGLLMGVPEDANERSGEQQGRFFLAHMMEFHRREDKATWWEYFRVLALEESDYEDERRALLGLELDQTLEAKRAPLQRYRFPSQELDARKQDNVYNGDGERIGKVADINYSERTIDIKKMVATADTHPVGVVFHNQVRADVLRKSLMRLGDIVLDRGFADQAPYHSAIDLLLRRPSPLVDADSGSMLLPGETTVQAACRLVLQLDGQVLAIQGPPGTGKTYTGAHMICALKQQGLTVGVTAVSHKVVINLMESAMEEASKLNLDLHVVHRKDGEYEGNWGIEYVYDYSTIRNRLRDGQVDVLGATPWCWARQDFEQSVDVLIVDEAGQMALSNVLASAPAGKNLVLLGDPQQLEQPLQSNHPEGSEASALYHLLNGEDTMPADKGLFLSETYRLHPNIAEFTSEVYYEGKVTARPELDKQAILPNKQGRFQGSGLRYFSVQHEGNQARSLEEVEAITGIVGELLDGVGWRDKDNNQSTLTEEDILVIAPYNSQVSALIEALPSLQHRIGTVDRFQGQEAPIVIYSMTSSRPEDAPRGMEFLYNPHRFNVATSRARAMCILVGSPALFEPECRTPGQMKMANGFCRYLEVSEPCKVPDSSA